MAKLHTAFVPEVKGLSNVKDALLLASEGLFPRVIENSPWAVLRLQNEARDRVLLYVGEDGGVCISSPLLRLALKKSSAFDRDLNCYLLLNPPMQTVNEVKDFLCSGNGGSAASDLFATGFDVLTESFFDHDLIRSIPELNRPPILSRVITDPDHKKYNIFHSRIYANQGKGMLDPKGGVTAAYTINVIGQEGEFCLCEITAGLAVCSSDDLYDRKRGANIAIFRLRAHLEDGASDQLTALEGELLRFRGVYKKTLRIKPSWLVKRTSSVPGVENPHDLKGPHDPIHRALHCHILLSALKTLIQVGTKVSDRSGRRALEVSQVMVLSILQYSGVGIKAMDGDTSPFDPQELFVKEIV